LHSLAGSLVAFIPRSREEARDLDRARAIVEGSPWDRGAPLHFTGSAVIVHPETRRVLLRWHERQQAWLQVGGHGDPGEDEPLAVARREAEEETGLLDLQAWPVSEDPLPIHLVVVPVPEGKGEPAHEHADLRYVLATATPDAARPESPSAPMRWLTFDEAHALTGEDNLRETLRRLEDLFPDGHG
jgi:8-oxo-dGTP pyrophosphatase MutT (NUDIX family)